MENLPDYEKLGSFYLGKKFELVGRQLLDEKVLYDAKDLTTHAMCVGMTGSGKTGLCLALLEEAAIDGIPAIALDPKGDLGNLLLAFPKLSGEDFRPWLEQADASRAGLSLEQLAEQTAAKWKSGLESWDQSAARVARYRESVDIAIYTPGSNAGIPMTVLKSFNAPPQAVIDDADVFRERIAGAASGLLTLMGIEADPLSSREHILLSNIFDTLWRKGQNLDLPGLIRAIQSPPMSKVGVFDLESFFPSADRMKLAMTLNNLLASPTFAGWLEGQPLDIKQLLYTSQGKPRLSIISIAHLGDSERMFFVTILLNELLSWMRTQPGTSSLRALFYMDEVYGYFPPSAKPPSKPPMLVLLKQARAFGLGIALATQNPVDLDYKGLSNIGTWFLGRLQTERDKARVLEGLEGAAAQSGKPFDRNAMEQTLAALGSRVFLMNNVHDDAPTIFQSRWALSFLRGPLSRQQIQGLMDPRRAELSGNSISGKSNTRASDEPSAGSTQSAAAPTDTRPILPTGVEERFWIPDTRPRQGTKLIYGPAILAQAACHFVRASGKIDCWEDISLLTTCERGVPAELWGKARRLPPNKIELSQQPEDDYAFGELPPELINAKQYKTWAKDLADHLYRNMPMNLFYCKELDQTSAPGETEMDARIAWTQKVREKRDEAKAKLSDKYSKLIAALENKIRTAQQRVDREKADYDNEKWNTALNFGTTLLGALFGNKVASRTNVSRTSSTARSLGKAAQERSDVQAAASVLESLVAEKYDLEAAFEQEVQELSDKFSVEGLTLETLEIPCRKGDIKVDLLCLLWIPYEVDSRGIAHPLVQLPEQTPN
ncbi:MAG: ATP-binding protein [Pirellulaceae bacterium]|nr:ATP-binding protein [Pirellulaceae bacterium]